MGRLIAVFKTSLLIAVISACTPPSDTSETVWQGQIDTLADGHTLVRNGDHGVWPSDVAWQIVEEVRIGAVDSDGPETFGSIVSLAVDRMDRVWVLDMQASELRVFDRNGVHVRSVGRSGAGPGEFRQPVRVDLSPEGQMWVVDPANARITTFDTAGNYVQSIRIPSSFSMLLWPGGFDHDGFYYAPLLRRRPFRVDLVRLTAGYEATDTLEVPTEPVEREEFTLTVDGAVQADEPVPFQGHLAWRLSQAGTLWALVTDQYRLFELDASGDTLREVTKTFAPIPVASPERVAALEELESFTQAGGKIDLSRIPDHRPAVRSFFVDTAGDLWVERATPYGDKRVTFDVFNSVGQYLGGVEIPFALQMDPPPIIRGGMLYGVIRDSLDVQYVIRARIAKPLGT